MHLTPLDAFVMALYGLIVLFVGWRASRTSSSSEDYFVAGRGASAMLVGISMIATMFSTISYLGTPAEMIAYGPGLVWGAIHGPITYIIVAHFVIPRIMRHRVTSGYELLESRFGPALRRAASTLFVLSRLVWMGFIIYTCGTAIAAVVDVPLPYILAAVGLVTTAYTVLGGIRAVLITDTLQFLILVAGGGLVIAVVTWTCGGFDWWPRWDSPQVRNLGWQDVKLFSLSPFDRLTVFGALFTAVLWWVCAATSDQMMIQRYLCTRDVRAARKSFLHCLLGELVISSMLWSVAVALLGYYLVFPTALPDSTATLSGQANRLFPSFIATQMPSGLRAIILAALFSAAMSSLSSGISALGTVLVVDFKGVFARGIARDDAALTRRAKLVGLAVGAVAIGLSFLIEFVPGRNLFDVLYRIGNLFSVPLFVLFVAAFFLPIVSRAGAWTAIAAGILAGVLFSYWQQIVGLITPTGDFSVILIMPAAMAVSLIAALGVSLLLRPSTQVAPDSERPETPLTEARTDAE